MFQPQATPYSTAFSPYGIGSSAGNFPVFQPTGGGVVDSGGPTVFRETLFSPVASNLGGGPLSFNTTNSTFRPQQYNKMSEHDMRAQELAAEEFERENRIEVCAQTSWKLRWTSANIRAGSNGGGEEK